MGDIVDLAGRLVIVRDAKAIAEHREQERKRRYSIVARPNRAKQRAARLNRLVAWADSRAIAAFYDEAERLTRRTKIVHEVDHIIPLQGEYVSGLHVETNLRVISKAENRKKSNTFEMVGDSGIEPLTSTV